MNWKARWIYAAEAAVLLPYVALTKQPVAIKGLIPLTLHRNIDPFNVAQFAGQSLLPALKKKRTNLQHCFTALAGITVQLTNWNKIN